MESYLLIAIRSTDIHTYPTEALPNTVNPPTSDIIFCFFLHKYIYILFSQNLQANLVHYFSIFCQQCVSLFSFVVNNILHVINAKYFIL
jgi:hypothetical protein